jgi:hypothetical protein
MSYPDRLGPLFVIVTDVAPHEPAWSQVVAEGAAVAAAAGPILGFAPDVVVASLVLDEGAPGPAPPSTLGAVLADQAAQGRTLAFLVPAILDLGILDQRALAEIVRASQRSAPSLVVHYDHVQVHVGQRLVQAFVEAVWDALAGTEIAPARLGVILVASGQGDARSRAEAYAVMRLIWEQLAAARGEIAFVRHPRPAVPETLAHCLATPLHWIAIPMLLWPTAVHGYAEVLFDDFRRAHPEAAGAAGFRLVGTIGTSPNVRAWLVERLLGMFRAEKAQRLARLPSLVHVEPTRESCVIGPEASCTMDILPRPLGPDLCYGAGVIAEIVDRDGLARLLEHFELSAERVFIKVTWHGYATGTFTDAAALDQLLRALPGRAILLEGHSTGRNVGGAPFDWETEARAHRAWLRDQEAEFLRRTGLAEVIARHRAQYVNVTEAHWDGACAPRAEVLRLLEDRGVQLRDETLADYVPAVVLEHRGAPFVSFARFKGPTRLAISNCFGLLPPPLRTRFHGPTIDHFARVCCDVARLYTALLTPFGLVEALHSAVRWNRDGLYRSRFGNYDLIPNPGIVTLSRGLVAADVLASRLQGQDVRRSAFFRAVLDELAPREPSASAALGAAIEQPIPDELVQRFV